MPGTAVNRRVRAGMRRDLQKGLPLTSGGLSCFRTCPDLPGDALIELDLRCGLG